MIYEGSMGNRIEGSAQDTVFDPANDVMRSPATHVYMINCAGW
jgi:hypothetical protein